MAWRRGPLFERRRADELDSDEPVERPIGRIVVQVDSYAYRKSVFGTDTLERLEIR